MQTDRFGLFMESVLISFSLFQAISAKKRIALFDLESDLNSLEFKLSEPRKQIKTIW